MTDDQKEYIVQGNLKIARLMGAKITDLGGELVEDRNLPLWSNWRGFVTFDLEDTPDPSSRHRWGFHLLKFHEDWRWIMAALKKFEGEEDYFTALVNNGVGIYEFHCNKYTHQLQDGVDYSLPDGFFIRTDERATSFDNVRLEAIWRGLVHFAEWKFNQGE